MNKSLEMVRGFLASQLNFIPAVFVIFAIYFGIIKQQPVYWKYAVLALLPFGFYLLRRYVKVMVPFFILHLGWAALPLLLAKNIAEWIIFILCGIVFFAVSIYFKMTRTVPEDGVLFVAMTCILGIVSYFAAMAGRGEKAAGVIAALAVVYVIYFMIFEYLTGYINYIKNNEVSNQSIPKKNIFKTSVSALVGFFTLFVGFAILLIKKNFLADLVYKIRDLIERFLTWLLSFAPEPMEQGKPVDESGAVEPMYEEMGEIVEDVYHLPPEIVELIDRIVTIGAYVIAATAILLVTYALFRAIVEVFKIKRDDNEEEVVLIKEKVTKIKNKKVENKVIQKQSTREKKIRKMYEDLVWKKNIGPKPDKAEKELVVNRLKYQTPKEQCRYMDSGEAIRRMYEKARYSGDEVTGNDVRAMKEICMLEGKRR